MRMASSGCCSQSPHRHSNALDCLAGCTAMVVSANRPCGPAPPPRACGLPAWRTVLQRFSPSYWILKMISVSAIATLASRIIASDLPIENKKRSAEGCRPYQTVSAITCGPRARPHQNRGDFLHRARVEPEQDFCQQIHGAVEIVAIDHTGVRMSVARGHGEQNRTACRFHSCWISLPSSP